MTKLKFTDKRENTVPTFGDLSVGDLFTTVGGEVPYIKTKTMYDDNNNPYNTVFFNGEFYLSDDDEEIEPIQEIEIIIKK